MTRTFKIFGRYGHRQRGSFLTSLPMQEHPDGSGYSALCSDGYFENCRVGKVVEVLPNGGEKTIWEDWTYILKDDGR